MKLKSGIASFALAALAVCQAAPAADAPGAAAVQDVEVSVDTVLQIHNRYRRDARVPPLQWSAEAARGAQEWARQLVATGQFEHSHIKGWGENLTEGTVGHHSLSVLMELWGAEKKDFVPGVFPNVARNGDWVSVGHYTQLIWPDTTHVGCGLAKARRVQMLVCRYLPQGNVVGQAIR